MKMNRVQQKRAWIRSMQPKDWFKIEHYKGQVEIDDVKGTKELVWLHSLYEGKPSRFEDATTALLALQSKGFRDPDCRYRIMRVTETVEAVS